MGGPTQFIWRLMIPKHPAANPGGKPVQGGSWAKQNGLRKLSQRSLADFNMTFVSRAARDASQCQSLPGTSIPAALHTEGRHTMALHKKYLRDLSAGSGIPELGLVWRARIDVWKWVKDGWSQFIRNIIFNARWGCRILEVVPTIHCLNYYLVSKNGKNKIHRIPFQFHSVFCAQGN